MFVGQSPGGFLSGQQLDPYPRPSRPERSRHLIPKRLQTDHIVSDLIRFVIQQYRIPILRYIPLLLLIFTFFKFRISTSISVGVSRVFVTVILAIALISIIRDIQLIVLILKLDGLVALS